MPLTDTEHQALQERVSELRRALETAVRCVGEPEQDLALRDAVASLNAIAQIVDPEMTQLEVEDEEGDFTREPD
jgi:hypothetical protein